jgi:uncharacterized protein (DUF2236 family)
VSVTTNPQPSSALPSIPEIGTDSLLWRYAGDWRAYLLVPATSVALGMVPGISAGVLQHTGRTGLGESASILDNTLVRLLRSVPQIAATIYDPEMPGRVRDYHHTIKGVDDYGDRYHALSPELYFASHAIFSWTVFATLEYFDHPLEEHEKVALYEDCKLWYRRYGISDRAMPQTWPEFETYWEHLTTEVMRDTQMARIVADFAANPTALLVPAMPAPVARILHPLLSQELKLLARMLLPPAARETLGWRISRSDRAKFAVQAETIRRAWPLLPPALREAPDAHRKKRQIADARRDALTATL